MAFLIHGSRKTQAGPFAPLFYKCPVCEELHTTCVIVYSRYFHIFWIPVFPYEKDAVANCTNCGFVRDEMKFGPALVKEFAEKRKEFRHPWWTRLLTLIVVALILLVLIIAPK